MFLQGFYIVMWRKEALPLLNTVISKWLLCNHYVLDQSHRFTDAAYHVLNFYVAPTSQAYMSVEPYTNSSTVHYCVHLSVSLVSSAGRFPSAATPVQLTTHLILPMAYPSSLTRSKSPHTSFQIKAFVQLTLWYPHGDQCLPNCALNILPQGDNALGKAALVLRPF